MEKSTSKRNPIVELLRFVFAVMVLVYHSSDFTQNDTWAFYGGYIAVEFFFILSGYFTAKAAMKPLDDMPAGKWAMRYTLKKFSAFAPTVVISILITAAVKLYTGAAKMSEIPYIVYEMFLLPTNGAGIYYVDGSLWYLSAMLITLPVFAYLIRKRSDFFMNIAYILVPMLTYAILLKQYGSIGETGFWQNIPRAFASLCMGFVCYRLSLYFDEKKILNKHDNSYIYVLAAILLLTVIGYSFSHGENHMDLLLIMMMTFSMSVIIPQKVNMDESSFVYKSCIFLGKMSLSLYCTHWALRLLLPYVFPDMTYDQYMAIYIPAAFALALAVMGLAARLKRALAEKEEITK